jgi:single-stranded-DNA-specific exonuclease
MNGTTWHLQQPSPDVVLQLAARLDISTTLAAILANRGLGDPAAAAAFLDPALSRLHSPLRMRDMAEAVYRITRAIRGGERMLVWGDYDVDGVTATALLLDFLRRHTPAVGYHIPHRTRDGCGLKREAIERYADAGVSLIITVDCGIADVDEVAAGLHRGVGFVITDHHEPQGRLPDADAILNPPRPGCPYPYKHLAGVGIAFKLAQALALLIGRGDVPADPGDAGLSSYLDLVALGTVADVAPLDGENRILVRHGMERLGGTRRVGLHALKEVAGMHGRPVRSAQLGYCLRPRINAAGQLDRADAAVDLLLAEDPARARLLAGQLDGLNSRRREIERTILGEAIALVEADPALQRDPVLVLSSPAWHPGVIGIVAAKLAERYARPALLVAEGAPGKGSARSTRTCDLYALLQRCRHRFVTFGGHRHAAGFTVMAGELPHLRRELNELAATAPGPPPAGRCLEIDAALSFTSLRPPLVEELRRLAPFGRRNEEPLFLTEGVAPVRSPRVVGRNHLRLTLVEKRQARQFTRQFIGFGLGDWAKDLACGHALDVVYDLDLEGGPATSGEQLRLRDLHLPYRVSGPDGNG